MKNIIFPLFSFLLLSGLSALNVYIYLLSNDPLNLGVAIFCGFGAIYFAIYLAILVAKKN